MQSTSVNKVNSNPDRFWTREADLFNRDYTALQLATGLIVPPRKAFTAASARAFLPYISIFELKSPDLLLVRLVGMAIVNRTRIDNTGRNMLDLMSPEIRAQAKAGFRELLETPCGATYISYEQYRNGSVPIEIVSFPFADSEGKPTLVVSLSIEIDRQELMLRGEDQMALSSIVDKRIIDIGSGTARKPRAS